MDKFYDPSTNIFGNKQAPIFYHYITIQQESCTTRMWRFSVNWYNVNSDTWYHLPKVIWTVHQYQTYNRHCSWSQWLLHPHQCDGNNTRGTSPYITKNQMALWVLWSLCTRPCSSFLLLEGSDIHFPRSIPFGVFDKWHLYLIFHVTSSLQGCHRPC